ncbi:patatin-like phospholipase family protein [Candidatus Paracaedibacter symbiosus]|uniref:patatin-like phospholipase family protein n=1 Tax=Candidatus Paracaedibacter symbiosus TaxID=244582 RepID=UPI0006902C7E|nr:patatin-like phospholipase family protein [Candidatus Paracaedibacter symbiosus]
MTFCCLVLSGCTTINLDNNASIYRPALPHYDNIKVAFVLGGGGAKGLAHLGVLEELTAAGIKPDLIVGCSAGAIVGALYADKPDLAHIKQLLLKIERDDLLDISLAHLPYGFSNGWAMKQFLKENLTAKTFADLQMPFVAVATNLKTGELTAFSSGDLNKSVRASAAFPSVFLPVNIQGNYFVDGGVANAVPVDIARKIGADFVIAVNLGDQLSDEVPSHVFGILKRSLEISYLQQGRLVTQTADYVINVPLASVGTFDEGLNPYVYKAGVNAARTSILEIKQKIKQHQRQHLKKR